MSKSCVLENPEEYGIASPEKYRKFRNKVKETIEKASEPLIWSEIKTRAGFDQKVPNNKWVRAMEEDIGLIREDSDKGKIWKLEKEG